MRRATLVLDDGTHVTASTANGWFTAWWPGSHDPTAAEIATAHAVTRQRLVTGGRVKLRPWALHPRERVRSEQQRGRCGRERERLDRGRRPIARDRQHLG